VFARGGEFTDRNGAVVPLDYAGSDDFGRLSRSVIDETEVGTPLYLYFFFGDLEYARAVRSVNEGHRVIFIRPVARQGVFADGNARRFYQR